MTDRRNEHEDFMKERRKGQDRRAHPRHSVAITMELTAGNDLYFHVSGNLSRGGAFFNRAIPHPVGTMVELTFQIPGDDGPSLRCKGEVVNIPDGNDGLGMGVRFIDLDPSDQERIELFVEQVKSVVIDEEDDDGGAAQQGGG